tara:strand:+ start:308 stop:967 length:660 start_codon:yes stop_codon:yes gene_type:complete
VSKEKIKPLFGLPIYHSLIDKKLYDKQKILKTILNNFKKSQVRSQWSKSLEGFASNKLHHALNDESNSKFKQPDYTSLIPLYTKEIKTFLESMPIKKTNFKFKIVNYTCMTAGHHMMHHIHTECDFSAIHYVQFDNKTQDSTVFTNTNDYPKFINDVYPQINQTFIASEIENSWAHKYFKIVIKEDDLIIFPAMLEHSVPNIRSDKTRVTIVFNIKLYK